MLDGNNGIIDPVNHELLVNELEPKQFGGFLDILSDVPSSVPLRPFTIDKAGIVNQNTYVNIKSLFSKKYVPVYCDISMQVELKGHRGIHMSRCEEALFELIKDKHESLEDFAGKLAQEIQRRQDSDAAYVSVKGNYLAERQTVKTKRNSHDKLILVANAKMANEKLSYRIGVRAFNITGCPCTETYTKFSVVPKLQEQGFNLAQIKDIIKITNSGTHTQRGIASVIIDKNDPTVTHRSLYDVLDRSCHLVFELLKRPDEHDLVLRALQKPQFTEDVVREIISDALSIFNKLNAETRITTTSLLNDSIHIHDVYTKIDRTFGELRKEL